MGYSSITDVTNILAQSLTSATSQTDAFNTTENLLNVGNVLNNNLITNDTVNAYIQMADREIDGMLTQLYKTPLEEVANWEGNLYSDLTEYNDYIILEETAPLSPGDIILLVSSPHQERHQIDEIIAYNMFSTVDPIQYEFPVGTRIIRVSYPDPIRFISARKAAATIYDKYFSAESSPGTSTFGQVLRDIARQQIDNILNGRTILHGIHRIGRRFANSNLIDQYNLPIGGESTRDIDQIAKG